MPDAVARDGYFQELSSAGFWPGPGADLGPAFYPYAYPAPPDFRKRPSPPAAARYRPALSEFLLPYSAVRATADSDAELMAFLETTYAAAADLAAWDRLALERA